MDMCFQQSFFSNLFNIFSIFLQQVVTVHNPSIGLLRRGLQLGVVGSLIIAIVILYYHYFNMDILYHYYFNMVILYYYYFNIRKIKGKVNYSNERIAFLRIAYQLAMGDRFGLFIQTLNDA